MKHKTAELSGARLDFAVAIARGLDPQMEVGGTGSLVMPLSVCVIAFGEPQRYNPSSNWALGGPILEKLIASCFDVHPRYYRDADSDPFHCDNYDGDSCPYNGDWATPSMNISGQTVLIAAMRAFVASKLGEEVDLP